MGRWVTSKGRHIYIPDEDEIVEQEKVKDRQIAENKKQADTRNESYEEWTDADAKKEYSKYDYDVTSKEWRDATKYTGGQYYMSIQQALYTGKMEQKTYSDGVKDMSPYIKKLDESMRPLSKNVMLNRTIMYDKYEASVGVSLDSIQKIAQAGDTDFSSLDKAIGKSFTFKGYLSTSYNESQNAKAGDLVLLKLKTPAGKKAIVTSNKLESEVILERNTNYTITGYDVKEKVGTQKQIVFYAEVKKGN